MMKDHNYPMVSIVTVNFRQAEVTRELMESLRHVTYPNLEVILVDNGIEEKQMPLAEDDFGLPVKVLTSRKNLGFAGGTNMGIRASKGEYILLLNNDTIVPSGFLEPMVELMEENPRAGIISPKIYFYDQPDVIQFAGASPINPLTGRGHKKGFMQKDDGSFEYTGPTALGNGACMLVRQQVFEEAGLLSELFFMYYEEHDLCERVRRLGWEAYFTSRSYIHHRQSMSMGKSSPLKTYYLARNRLLYMRRLYKGASFYTFLLYYLLIGMPSSFLRHLVHGEVAHALSIIRGIAWNLSNHKIHFRHEAIDL